MNGGEPYCPNLAALGQVGVNYVTAVTSKPSDSFPGLMTLVTGSTPKSMGIYYDVAYDRSLDAPSVTTGNGLAAGPCTPYGVPTGTTTEYEEGIDFDQTKLNGGAPGASLTDGGIASINAQRLVRNPATGTTPANLLAADLPLSESPTKPTGIGPTEDDISLLWLKKGTNVVTAVDTLEQNASSIGLGEILFGPTVALNYNVPGTGPGQDPRTPDIIVVPNVGVTYSNNTKKHAEHGGFSHDDTNVILLVSNPNLTPGTVSAPTATAQVAPTIVQALGLNPRALQGVQAEGTAVLRGLTQK